MARVGGSNQPEWYRALQAQDELPECCPAVTQPFRPPQAPGPRLSQWQVSLQALKPHFISTQPLQYSVVWRGNARQAQALARWPRSAHSQAQGLDAGFVSWHLAREWPLSALYVCFSTMVFSLGPLEEFRELTPHPNFVWAGAQTGPRIQKLRSTE